ncbi:Phosphomethylpyrimidine kinase [Bathymodiolus thermophilus thioautotrophic gill symbiont]|uniref:bifunctional hydroxymethylpyrimidine kinase/phosphomethylpyrimidine kinase n=1 Tax=Bathymodiolus thermophilus thioautotrophic gill symbiont TaxID=2360 RepID=UPI0010B9D783|nr:hydroxymethylpyrimidine/phosphomethylpyrimidine kinase [Bathymodiolus thermophilus thioautotrophic gill symbiont]SHA09212.1 Phosphomethylpyrimidine kinase [Bathymodiolus thermophilus thioautotrophic gill symbiont]
MNEAVLVLSGLDPCGGAGIAADIETINQFGLTPLPIVTTMTVQNTQSVAEVQPVDVKLMVKQFHHLQADINFEVVKIGLLSSSVQIKAIADLVKGKTIVLDPIVKASTQEVLLQTQVISTLKQDLLPLVEILTPNMAELFTLSGEKDEQKAIEKLACKWILLTTTDVSESSIEHRLYHRAKLVKSYTYNKLSGNYHGSGCTLSSAISALIASGANIELACKNALDYTYQTLLNAKNIGKMQCHPNRMPVKNINDRESWV